MISEEDLRMWCEYAIADAERFETFPEKYGTLLGHVKSLRDYGKDMIEVAKKEIAKKKYKEVV